MELRIDEYQLPAEIKFNFEQLKNEVIASTQKYVGLVYSDEDIKLAKADRSALNKLKKAINDERIRREREYMQPFNEFKAQVNEIIGIIDQSVNSIDKQIKECDEKRKLEKQANIRNIWEESEHPNFLQLEKVFDSRWLNASYSMKQIEEDINAYIKKVDADISVLEQLDAYSFEAIEYYKTTLELSTAIAEAKRLVDIQKRKEEAEARRKAEEEEAQRRQAEIEAETSWNDLEKAPSDSAEAPTIDSVEESEEIPVEEPKEYIKPSTASWISFSALLTVDQALKLKAFFEENSIEFKKI